MMTNNFLAEEESDNASEKRPENSAFACEQCNIMYVYPDTLAINMTCCGESLKKLKHEGPVP